MSGSVQARHGAMPIACARTLTARSRATVISCTQTGTRSGRRRVRIWRPPARNSPSCAIRSAPRAAVSLRRVQATGAGADDVRARDRSLAAASGAERRASAALSDMPDLAGEPVAVGDAVRDPGTGLRGVVIAIEGEVAVVQGDRVRMRVALARLVGDARAVPHGGGVPRGEIRPAVVAAPEQIDVRGQRAAEACAEVREAVDAAAVAGRPRLLVIHGIGTGALRAAVREELARHPLVDKVDPAPPKEGGDGATYAVLDSG